jgi:hypothetical protein
MVCVETQLQALDNVLQTLRLKPNDIQEIDQIASLINDFKPAAFTSLAYELVALSQNAAAPAPATAAGNQSAAQAKTSYFAPAALLFCGVKYRS